MLVPIRRNIACGCPFGTHPVHQYVLGIFSYAIIYCFQLILSALVVLRVSLLLQLLLCSQMCCLSEPAPAVLGTLICR